MSDVISIKKVKRKTATGELQVAYAVSAMSIGTQQGRKLIPNPSGKEASLFETLEAAQEAVLRAGFDAEYEGKVTLAFATQAPSPKQSNSRTSQGAATLEATVPLLIEHLQDRESGVVAQAVFALGSLKPTEAITHLIEILGHDDPSVRKNLAEAFARYGQAALAPLVAAYQQANKSTAKQAPYIRLTILNSFCEFLDQSPNGVSFSTQWLPLMPFALNDNSWLVRAQAATLVGKTAQALEQQALQQKQMKR